MSSTQGLWQFFSLSPHLFYCPIMILSGCVSLDMSSSFLVYTLPYMYSMAFLFLQASSSSIGCSFSVYFFTHTSKYKNPLLLVVWFHLTITHANNLPVDSLFLFFQELGQINPFLNAHFSPESSPILILHVVNCVCVCVCV